MKLFSNRKRPVHLGPYPLERLPRRAGAHAWAGVGSGLPARPAEPRSAGPRSAVGAYRDYVDLCDGLRFGDPSPAAPVPDDPQERADHLKAGLYFLDADMVGIAALDSLGRPRV